MSWRYFVWILFIDVFTCVTRLEVSGYGYYYYYYYLEKYFKSVVCFPVCLLQGCIELFNLRIFFKIIVISVYIIRPPVPLGAAEWPILTRLWVQRSFMTRLRSRPTPERSRGAARWPDELSLPPPSHSLLPCSPPPLCHLPPPTLPPSVQRVLRLVDSDSPSLCYGRHHWQAF